MEKDEKQTNNGAKEEKNCVFLISNVLTYIGRQIVVMRKGFSIK